MSRASALTKSEAARKRPDVVTAPDATTEPAKSKEFDLQSDNWSMEHLLRPHQRRREGVANFSDLPEWLRPDSKEYVKHLLEEAATDPRAIVNILVALRYFGRLLPDFNSPPIDLRLKHARQLARRLRLLDLGLRYKHRIKRTINRFMAFVRQKHPEVLDNNFQVVLPRVNTKESLNRQQGQIVDSDTEALIVDGCLSDLQKYREAKSTYIDRYEDSAEYYRRWNQRRRQYPPGQRPNPPLVHLRTLHKRAIKGQATILAICVGRRAAAICNLPHDVKVEKGQWTNEAGEIEQGVWIRFVETKVTRAHEDVFCPDAYGELVVKAIKTAKELTEDLRRENPRLDQHLFLIPGRARKSAMVLSPGQVNYYLNGECGHDNGLIQRYDIPCGRVTTHAFRRTRATKAWRGGMQVHEISADLGQLNVNVAPKHYIIRNEASRHRYETLMNHGALSGAMIDFTGGVETVNVELGRRQVEVMAKQGRVLRPNPYGYCGLAGSGHCVRTTPCYIGDTVESDGCDFHILSPDALPALKEDKEALEASIEINNNGQWCGQLIQSMRNQLEVVNRRIERALDLQKKLDTTSCIV